MSYDAEPFRVAVKDSASEANEAVRRLARSEGEVVQFDSAADAHQRARDLSEAGETPVKVQRAAPQDPADVDAYLVAWPERRRRTPDGTPTEGLTFDTAANQYGALGEAVVCSPAVNPPLLTHFARVDSDLSEREAENLHVAVDADPDPVVVDGDARWEPDCRAVVRPAPNRPVLTEFWCEVKAGDGSFERSQRAAMRAKAREATVLKIRVDLDELPDSYTAWVRKVEPDAGGERADDDRTSGAAYRVNASLDSF
ncbi:hypothetical protein [Halorussus litoreus]|uniref:hypothetical protein n=1 Tax=Halorussus litoreus TaxID=1710536 RepID=UPI000E2698A8|nr:hypothetical protein [Halorussus litoreus]